MITQTRCPSLRRWRVTRRPAHPAQRGSLREIETRRFERAVNSWRTQVGFSVAMRQTRPLHSLFVGLLPAPMRFREIHFQYILEPARCHRTTVSGYTIRSACFQPDQQRLKSSQQIHNLLRTVLLGSAHSLLLLYQFGSVPLAQNLPGTPRVHKVQNCRSRAGLPARGAQAGHGRALCRPSL